MAKLFRPVAQIKAPEAAKSLATGSFCGLPIGSPIEKVVATWGLPSGLSKGGTVLDYAGATFKFTAQRRRLWGCTLKASVPGLADAQHTGLGIKMGQGYAEVLETLNAGRGLLASPLGKKGIAVQPNRFGIQILDFIDGKLAKVEYAGSNLKGYTSPKESVVPVTSWGKEFQRLCARTEPASVPDSAATQWTDDTLAGVPTGAPTLEAFMAVWGVPNSWGVTDGKATSVEYAYEGKAYVRLFIEPENVVVHARGARLTGLAVLPKGIRLGDGSASIQQVLGAHKGHSMLFYTNALGSGANLMMHLKDDKLYRFSAQRPRR